MERSRIPLRILMILIGLALIALTFIAKYNSTETTAYGSAGNKSITLSAGDVIEQKTGYQGKITELSVYIMGNEKTNGLQISTELTKNGNVLMYGNNILTQTEPGMRKISICSGEPIDLDGSEKLVIRLAGQGSTKLYGEKSDEGMSVNGSYTGFKGYMEMGSTVQVRAYITACFGIIILLLGLLPAAKERRL